MNTSTVSHDRERGITTVELRGCPTFAQIRKLLKDEVERELLPNVIWIIHAGSLSNLSTDDLKSFFITRMEVFERRQGGYTIFVATGTAEKFLLKWYAAFGESIAKMPVTFALVSNIAEAHALIDGKGDASTVKGRGSG